MLLDASSSARLAAHAPTLRLEPASLTKLMSAYVVFTAIGEKRFGLEDVVTVSATAFAAPGRDGARMFVEPAKPVTVGELLQGMLTVSGNDAATALAEHTSGSVDVFVQRMNDEARRLGMVDTRFSNPTGLSDSQQYSTAADLARLAQRLMVDFPQYANFFNRRELTYNRVTQLNRNRLLWSDPTVDGMKTGQLATVGWSIIATASRTRGTGSASYERRMIAVV
ncbi:MAG: D-alanyl-D-alanine carboxypeptidase family protein, partial [Burkholderiaceae bacterium]